MRVPDCCDRCKGSLELSGTKTWKMSWFTEEELCELCEAEEKKLKTQLWKSGYNVIELEGCGYIPGQNAKDFITK